MPGVDGHRTRAIHVVSASLYRAGLGQAEAQSYATRIVDAITDHAVETHRELLRAEAILEETKPKG